MANEKVKVKVVEVDEFLRYELSAEEIKEKGASSARSVQLQQLAQEEQKGASAQFKERIERFTADIGRYSREISLGYDMRNIKCRVQAHPDAGHQANRSPRPQRKRLSSRMCQRTIAMLEASRAPKKG